MQRSVTYFLNEELKQKKQHLGFQKVHVLDSNYGHKNKRCDSNLLRCTVILLTIVLAIGIFLVIS